MRIHSAILTRIIQYHIPISHALELISSHTPTRRRANGRWSHLHDMATPYKGVHSAVMTLPSARDHFPFQQPQDQPG